MTQNRELDVARFIVEKTNNSLFLTGKAGTGKTTFLRDVNKYTKKKHIVLAPTGVAAVNAGAMTIHSFFQFGFGPYIKGVTEPEPGYMMHKSKLELIRNLELIIIDEVSMVRADLMDHINDELQRIRRNQQPFGGVQLLMIGDLQQLPPVVTSAEEQLLKTYYRSPYFFHSNVMQRHDYLCIELGKVYRQTNQHFIDILNRAREGQVTQEDINELNARYVPNFQPADGDNYIQLVTHNNQADSINSRRMAELPYTSHTFDAKVTGTFPEDSFPTSNNLELKQHAQVMFIRNDSENGVVNGTLGEVESINDDSISVRISGSGRVVDVEPVAWENIRYQLNEETEQIEPKKIGTFKQFPLKPAWAITIHKSQGLTFDKAVIDAHAAFSPGQAYVALSRCRTLEGVILSSRLSASVFITDNTIKNYMENATRLLANIEHALDYQYFDYERPVEEPKKPKQKAVKPEIVNTPVYEALKEWRNRVSKEANVPAYCIFVDKCMAAISAFLPETKDELLSLYGFGQKSWDTYGNDVLDVVRRSKTAECHRTVPAEVSGTATQSESSKEAKTPTCEISYQMYKEGKTIQEIAQERGYGEGTIINHLTRYVASGDIDVHEFTTDDIISKVAAYNNAHPDVTALKEYFEYFNQEISYNDIRMALAYLENH